MPRTGNMLLYVHEISKNRFSKRGDQIVHGRRDWKSACDRDAIQSQISSRTVRNTYNPAFRSRSSPGTRSVAVLRTTRSFPPCPAAKGVDHSVPVGGGSGSGRSRIGTRWHDFPRVQTAAICLSSVISTRVTASSIIRSNLAFDGGVPWARSIQNPRPDARSRTESPSCAGGRCVPDSRFSPLRRRAPCGRNSAWPSRSPKAPPRSTCFS